MNKEIKLPSGLIYVIREPIIEEIENWIKGVEISYPFEIIDSSEQPKENSKIINI